MVGLTRASTMCKPAPSHKLSCFNHRRRQAIVDPTQRDPPKTEKSRPNRTHGSTQPMAVSESAFLELFRTRCRSVSPAWATCAGLRCGTAGTAPAPLKLRPYGAIQICLLLLLLLLELAVARTDDGLYWNLLAAKFGGRVLGLGQPAPPTR